MAEGQGDGGLKHGGTRRGGVAVMRRSRLGVDGGEVGLPVAQRAADGAAAGAGEPVVRPPAARCRAGGRYRSSGRIVRVRGRAPSPRPARGSSGWCARRGDRRRCGGSVVMPSPVDGEPPGAGHVVERAARRSRRRSRGASARLSEPRLSTRPMPMATRVARPASAARRPGDQVRARRGAARPGSATSICQPSPRKRVKRVPARSGRPGGDRRRAASASASMARSSALAGDVGGPDQVAGQDRGCSRICPEAIASPEG